MKYSPNGKLSFLLLIISIISISYVNNNLLTFNDDENFSIYDILEPQIFQILNKTFNDNNIDCNNKEENDPEKMCVCNFKKAFNKDNEHEYKFYMTKLIEDSSKGKNEISTYGSCTKRKYDDNTFDVADKINFVVTMIDKSEGLNLNSTDYEENWYMFGLCVPKCESYRLIVYSALKEILELEKEDSVYFYTNHSHYGLQLTFTIIIGIIVAVQVIVLLFNLIPFCLFKSCFKKKYFDNNDIASQGFSRGSGDESTNSIGGPKLYNKREFKQFKLSFSLAENGEELFTHNPKMNNDSGITYIKGIRGFSILFCCFGFLFYDLYNSPVSVYVENTFIEMMRNIIYSIFYIGLRYSPRILLSCSGYTLVYKFYCYLDENSLDELDRRLNRKRNRKKTRVKKQGGDDKEPTPIQNIGAEEEEEEDEEEEEEESEDNDGKNKENTESCEKTRLAEVPKVSDVKVSFLLRFIFYQVHKYIIYVFVLITMAYCINLITEKGPIWDYFKDYIIHLDGGSFFKAFFLLQSFFHYGEHYEIRELFTTYLWVLYCEMLFFLFTSSIIFLGYKFRFKFDQLFLTFIILTIVVKIIVVICKALSKDFDFILTFYYHIDGSFWIHTPIYNYIYYAIGFYFGSMNYVFQKKLDYKDISILEKPYLKSAVTMVRWFKEKTKKVVYVICFIIILIFIAFSLIETIILYFDTYENQRESHLTGYLTNLINNIFLFFDMDIIVFLVQVMAFGFYIKGENYINNMFCHPMWTIFERIYFCFILLFHPITLYALSQSETRIIMNLYNSIIYSLICGFCVFLACIITFIFFELPYKRIVKLISNAYLKTHIEEENEMLVIGRDEI